MADSDSDNDNIGDKMEEISEEYKERKEAEDREKNK